MTVRPPDRFRGVDLDVVDRVMAIAEREVFFQGDGLVTRRRCGRLFMKHPSRALVGRVDPGIPADGRQRPGRRPW